MHKGYQLKFDYSQYDSFFTAGNKIHQENNSITKPKLHSFLENSGEIYASNIMETWFKNIEANVFISHSHKDEKAAICFAGWLKQKLGIVSFIDSCVWGHSVELQIEMDRKFAPNADRTGSYDYEKRNITTSHVNMMLATSLTKMIDKCECIIFLNTPNSVSAKGCIESTGTLSPWIYSEIETTRVIQKKLPRISMESQMISTTKQLNLNLIYDLRLNHLHNLEINDLIKIERTGLKNLSALDLLYSISNR